MSPSARHRFAEAVQKYTREVGGVCGFNERVSTDAEEGVCQAGEGKDPAANLLVRLVANRLAVEYQNAENDQR